jgi:hypothetical protein
MKLRKTLVAIFISAGCIALGLGMTGCTGKGVSDQALTTDIQAKLYADADARSANIKVNVANGVVTLTGDAPSSDIALKVVNIANGTSGIKSVDNQLKVAPAGTVADAPAPMTQSAPVASSATKLPAEPTSSSAQNMMPPAPSVPPPPPVQDMRNSPAPPPREHREAAAPPAPPKPVSVTIPSGTDLAVQMIDGISSKTNTEGQTFRASLSSPVVIDGATVLPAGSDATVLLATAKGAGRIKGNSELEVRLVSVEHAGHTYKVDTNVHEVVGKGRGKQSAVRTGIGAAAGAVIGALAGGGKGAAIGSLAGGGAGAGIQLATHGEQVNIPSETQLTFTLQSPVEVTLRRQRE